jgi:hypothetical protein
MVYLTNHQKVTPPHHFDALDRKPNWSRFSTQNQVFVSWLDGAGRAGGFPGCTRLNHAGDGPARQTACAGAPASPAVLMNAFAGQ